MQLSLVAALFFLTKCRAYAMPPSLIQPRAPVCGRELDPEAVANTVTSIASSDKAAVIYIGAGTVLCQSVCSLLIDHKIIPGSTACYKCEPVTDESITSLSILPSLNEGHQLTVSCDQGTASISSTLTIVLTAIQQSKTPTGAESNSRRTEGAAPLLDILKDRFKSDGIEYSSLEVMPVHKRDANTTAAGHELLYHIHINSFKHPDMPAPVDQLIKMYSDYTGFIRSSPTVSTNSSAAIERRNDGAGFKINWNRFSYDGGFLGTPDSDIPQFATAIANDWARGP